MVPGVHHHREPKSSLSPLGCLSGVLTAPGGARECCYGNTESFFGLAQTAVSPVSSVCLSARQGQIHGEKVSSGSAADAADVAAEAS